MISDIFLMSLDALRSHKARTFLTIMGIIIGISSVIIVTTSGSSVEKFIEEQWNVFDPTGMVVGTGSADPTPHISFGETVFTNRDIENIKNLPHVKNVAPVGIIPLKKISEREGFLKWVSVPGGSMYASTPAMLDVLSLKIKEGRIFTDGKKEILVSEGLLNIFGKDKKLKVGDVIYLQRLDGIPIRSKIVGILKGPEEFNILSQLTTPSILGPIKPYYSTFFGSNVGPPLKRVTAYSILYAIASDKLSIETAKNEILDYLNSGGSDAIKYKHENIDFVIISQEYILNRVDQVVNAVSMLITIIAFISLIVGGIGIANIMYATVTERTREIGTMMAIGAKRKYILQLFLFQSMIVGFLGGILGCILGASGSIITVEFLGDYIEKLAAGAYSGKILVVFSWEWFIVSLLFGIAIGVFAGVLPARKAAKMDPVVALRYQ
jgi:putative ABC transport system permease protein